MVKKRITGIYIAEIRVDIITRPAISSAPFSYFVAKRYEVTATGVVS